MIRTAARKAVLLAAAALSMGTLAVNCSHRNLVSDSDVGSVGLAITLPSGATVTTVHYSVKNSATLEVAQGDIPVADSGATISVVVGGISSGSGYTVTLSASASDGSACLGTSTPFAVTANASTAVNVLLLCRGVTGTGTITANGQIDNCPAVSSFAVTPLATGVNGHINVNASGTDLDAGDTLTFAWTATAGTFNTPASAAATFTCPATSSVVTLTVTVSDSPASGTTTPKCSTSRTVVVNCGLCGNGTVDTASGEQCDPPNGVTCNNSCQTIPIVCGNGIVQAGEQCDPPNGTTCSATCQTIAGTGGATGTGGRGTGGAGTGGAGTGGAGTGGAGTGGASTGGAGTGGASTGGITLGCAACESSICAPQGVGCSTLTGSARTACDAAVTCIRTTHCDVDGDTSFCYCGTASQDDGSCSAAPLGLCIPQLEAADPNILPADTVTQRFNKIAADLVDPSLPLGKATGVIGCDAFSCNTASTCAGQF